MGIRLFIHITSASVFILGTAFHMAGKQDVAMVLILSAIYLKIPFRDS